MCEQETRCFDCLAELYGMLNEDDVLFGLWKRRGAAHETRAALSCIQHGMLVRGQDFLEEAINKNQAGAYQSPGEHSSRCAFSGSKLARTARLLPMTGNVQPVAPTLRHSPLYAQ